MAASPQETRPLLTEEYILRMAPLLEGEFGFVCLLPWRSAQAKPPNVIAPDPVVDRHTVSARELEELLSATSTLLVPCTFESRDEPIAAARLMEQLESHEDAFLFLLQLLEGGTNPQVSNEQAEVEIRRFDSLLAIGATGVLLAPEDDPDNLRRRVEQERAVFDANAERMKLMLAVNDENANKVREKHLQLVWQSIPRNLMPKFAPLDRNLLETSDTIGSYQLTRRFATRLQSGRVLLAKSEEQGEVVIKVFDKHEIFTPAEVECIYREYIFLLDTLSHPHITRCHCMLHSATRVYCVFEFAGWKNMAQLLEAAPEQKLPAECALDVTLQMANALAYCHSMSVVHRHVCPHHVAMEEQGERLFCRLVDFSSAIKIEEGQTAQAECGSLPCMAPEVMVGEPYLPMPVDCWCLGIALLEAASGLGSLQKAVQWDEDTDCYDACEMIRQFFEEEHAHSLAIAHADVRSQAGVLTKLERLLQVVPTKRASMNEILSC